MKVYTKYRFYPGTCQILNVVEKNVLVGKSDIDVWWKISIFPFSDKWKIDSREVVDENGDIYHQVEFAHPQEAIYLADIELNINGWVNQMEIWHLPDSDSFVGVDVSFIEQVSEKVFDPYQDGKTQLLAPSSNESNTEMELLASLLKSVTEQYIHADKSKQEQFLSYLCHSNKDKRDQLEGALKSLNSLL